MDKNFNYSNLKLGIIGGGQLGKIMSQKAKKMGFHVTILDPTFNCPAAQVSDKHIMGGFHDVAMLEQLVQETDVTTFELEHVETSILKELFDNGHVIHPSPYVIELIQNKYEQKKLLDEYNIMYYTPFDIWDNPDKVSEKVKEKLNGKKVYISIDMDVFGEHGHWVEPFGITPYHFFKIVKDLDIDLVGFDIVELFPSEKSENLAAKIIVELISLF